MSGLDPGTYYIINSELSPFSSQLAANYIGSNTPLVVSKSLGFLTQQWRVSGEPGAPQTISPVYDPALEAGPAGNFVEALNAASYTWNITKSGDGYFIADPNTGNVWAINKAAEGQQIVLEPKKTPVSQLQVWKFPPA